MKKAFLSLIVMLALIAPTFAQTKFKLDAKAKTAAADITAAQMRDYLSFVASDEMEGRDTPSRGLDTTAKFIATMLSRWGVKPAGDNAASYFQKMNLVRSTVDDAKTSLDLNGEKYPFGDDFIRVSGSNVNALSAPLVFGRDGWFVKSKNFDAFDGVDVKGKIVVLYSTGTPTGFSLTPLPDGLTRADLTGVRGADWADPLSYATSKGAVGVIVVASPQTQTSWTQIREFYSRGRARVEKFETGSGSSVPNAALPVILVSQKLGANLFNGETVNPLTATETAKAFDLNVNKKATLNITVKPEIVVTQNVIGMIEGSDPILKKEFVAVGAHYDHIGISQNANGTDKINNGADDDGSGTVAILAMAEALAKSPKKPKRSVLFVWHCGEEKGLWGSDYFTRFPTVDLKSIVTQLNIDMIGRSKKPGDTIAANKDLSGTNDVYVIGSKMMSAQLGTLSEQVNNAYLKVGFDYRYDDTKDPNRFFFRSDHFNYAKNGVPIIFYFDGVHEDYHRVGDEYEKIDYDKMQKVTRTVFMTMWAVADLKTRPVVDKQLPAELTRR